MNQSRATVLVVDDSRFVRASVSQLLKDRYYTIEASDGQAAFEIINDNPNISTVISDIQMPILDGISLIHRIRNSKNQRISQLPIIITTGSDDTEDLKSEALRNGATDFISKPFNRIELTARIRAHIETQVTVNKLKVIQESSTLDPITHLANEPYLYQRGTEHFSLSTRQNNPLSLIRLSIDDIDTFMTSCGEAACHKILRKMGHIFIKKTRVEDIISHFELGQYAILLPVTNIEAARLLADRILSATKSEIFAYNEGVITVRLSIGITSTSEYNVKNFESLYKLTENNLEIANKNGGNQIICGQEKADKMEQTQVQNTLKTIDQLSNQLSYANQHEINRLLPILMHSIKPILQQHNQINNFDLNDEIEHFYNMLNIKSS